MLLLMSGRMFVWMVSFHYLLQVFPLGSVLLLLCKKRAFTSLTSGAFPSLLPPGAFGLAIRWPLWRLVTGLFHL